MTVLASQIVSLLNLYFPEKIESFLCSDTNFQLLVAIILSAKCSDRVVNRVTQPLFATYPDAESLAKGNLFHIQDLIKPCGQWRQKAARILSTAQTIKDVYGGCIPDKKEDLLKLRGVGDKTASVYRSQALKADDEFPVDSHILRLSLRWGCSNGKTPSQASRDLQKFFVGFSWRDLHVKMIAYGRKYCRARPKHCRCKICFLTKTEKGVH